MDSGLRPVCGYFHQELLAFARRITRFFWWGYRPVGVRGLRHTGEMERTIVQVLLKVKPGSTLPSEVLVDTARTLLERVDGFEGLSTWLQNDRADQFLDLIVFESPRAADCALRTLMDADLMPEESGLLDQPPATHQWLVTAQEGADLLEASVGEFLSLVTRIEEPGYGFRLDDDYDRIFADLRTIAGCRGTLRAMNPNLPEERTGFVIWRDSASFRESLPPLLNDEVELWRRVR